MRPRIGKPYVLRERQPYTGFYFEKEARTDGQRHVAHSVWWERFYRPKGEIVPGQSKHRWTFFSTPELKSLKQVLVTAHDRAALDDNGVALQHEIQEELDERT
jgi:hypothetical protein